MKKLLALVLALCMVTGVMSALAEGFTPAASYDVGERKFDGGEIKTVAVAAGGGTVDTVAYAGEAGKDYTDEKVYTCNDYIASTTSMDWNPHTWETHDDGNMVDMLTTGFYAIVLNADKTGYAIVPEMAAELPVDVTAEYVGKFGIAEGEANKAFRIALNQDATWENGEKITADDYIYSMQQQLNPKMLNRRADSYYAGDLIVYNAKNYLYAGKTTYDKITDTVDNLIAAGTDIYVDLVNLWNMGGAVDADGNVMPDYVSIADDTMYRDAGVEDENADEAWVSGKYVFENYLAAGKPYESYQGEYLFTASIAPETAWEDVGLVKVDDYTIDLILEKPMEEAAFYMPYNLGSNWLVYKPLYEECKSFFDAEGKAVETEEEAATVTTDYCKSLEKTWYGYRDGKHIGQYQTDNYSITVISDHATEMMAFEAGQIDGVSLQSDDKEKYASSSYIMYEPQSYTTKVTFNTNYDKLLERGTGSQILVIDEFREAFALAIDRQHFVTAYTAAGTAGFGLLNYQYVYNPFTGEAYRDSEGAKDAMVSLYGLSYGEGTEYATLDEAYDAMTGYNMDLAKQKMAEAYDKAIAAGIWDGETPITIDFRVYQNDTIYVQMFTYFDEQLKEAAKGSGFEGKISLTMTVDADYYNTNYSGNADIIFTTWGGAAMQPFTMMNQCYTDGADGSGNQMEYGFDTKAIQLTIKVDGKEVTDNLCNWTNWVGSSTDEALVGAITEQIGSMSDYDYATRCAFLAACEKCFLSYYATTPVYYRNVASLHSQKINYPTYQYVMNVGFGGIRYYTYNYDDAEWADYIAANTLQY